MQQTCEITCIFIEFGLILQGKRGIEKQPFQLPDFIAATGIEKIRQVNLILLCLMDTIFLLAFMLKNYGHMLACI